MGLEKCIQPDRIPFLMEVWPQVLVGLVVTLTNCQVGIFLAHSSVLIPQLADDKNIQGFDKSAASWIAGIYSITAIFGALAGPVLDIAGRKKTLILSQVPLLIHWIIMGTTYYSVWPIYVARTFAGIGSGLLSVAQYVYIAEIANKNYRDPLAIMIVFSSTIGILLTSAVGSALEWHVASLIFGLINLANAVALFFIPESPYWMACFNKGSPQAIKRELRFLNRPEWVNLAFRLFQEAWGDIQKTLKSAAAESNSQNDGLGELFSILKDKTTLVPLALVTIALTFQQLSGVYLFISYSNSILASMGRTTIGGVEISVDRAMVLTGILRVLTTIASAVASAFWSKNTIMMASGLVTGLSAASTAIFMSLNGVTDIDLKSSAFNLPDSPNETNSLMVILSLFIYAGAGAFGLMVIPWTLASDLFSMTYRAFANTFSIVFGNVMIFLIVKTFPYWLDTFDLPVAFGIFSTSGILFVAFVWYFIPNSSKKHPSN